MEEIREHLATPMVRNKGTRGVWRGLGGYLVPGHPPDSLYTAMRRWGRGEGLGTRSGRGEGDMMANLPGPSHVSSWYHFHSTGRGDGVI